MSGSWLTGKGPFMGVADIADDVLRFAEETRDGVSEMLFEPRIALGVTGLSRAGKTVFITSLIANLLARGRLSGVTAIAEDRIQAVVVAQHPDRGTPRFDYEAHLKALSGPSPIWPQSTRHISQIRLSIRYKPTGFLSGLKGAGTLNLDIIDYPGEWLLDLSLLDQSYNEWSAKALSAADGRRAQVGPWLGMVAARNSEADFDEGAAKPLAAAFTAYLGESRKAGQSGLAPGRFLMPGDMEGSPALAFCPLPKTEGRDPLRKEFEKRYDAYKRHVVKPFFRDHFAKLDRQIVLVDLLSALNDGPGAVGDLSAALGEVLKAFRPGRNSWLSSILGTRIDRILFAATKADHLHSHEHDRLKRLMTTLLSDAVARAEFKGADVDALAMASVRATVEQEGERAGRPYRAVRGRLIDSGKEVAVDPGELSADPATILSAVRHGDHQGGWLDGEAYKVMQFAPPLLKGDGLPHIRLGRAIDFLIGDKLT
ncbi:MAG: YcjX family protein [Pikeienuella sp.]